MLYTIVLIKELLQCMKLIINCLNCLQKKSYRENSKLFRVTKGTQQFLLIYYRQEI